MSELGGLLKVIWSSSLILQMEELSPKEKHQLVSHSRARSHGEWAQVQSQIYHCRVV